MVSSISCQHSAEWQGCLEMTKCWDNVGWPPSLSQNTITCLSLRLAPVASQLSQARTGTQCWWLLSTPRWHVKKGEVCSHQSSRNKVNLQFIHNSRKIEKTRINSIWCMKKSTWTRSQIWLLIIAPVNWLRTSPSTTRNVGTLTWKMRGGLMEPDGLRLPLSSEISTCISDLREEGPILPPLLYLIPITYLVLINSCLNMVILVLKKILILRPWWKSSHIEK